MNVCTKFHRNPPSSFCESRWKWWVANSMTPLRHLKQDRWRKCVAATHGSTDLWQNTETSAVHATDGTLSGFVFILLQHCSLTISRQQSRASVPHTHWHAGTHSTARTVHSYMHSHCWVCSASSALWQYWTFSKLRDWSVWLCRNAQYCILNPRQAVCFDRCTKAYKRQSGAGTCEAHWVWIDSFRALRCVSSVGRRLSLRGLLYSGTMLKYSSSIDGLS